MKKYVTNLGLLVIREFNLLKEVLRLTEIKSWNFNAIRTLGLSYSTTIAASIAICLLFYNTGSDWVVPAIVLLTLASLYNYLRKNFVIATFGDLVMVKSLGEFKASYPPVRRIHIFEDPLTREKNLPSQLVYSEFYFGSSSFPKNTQHLVIRHRLHKSFVIPATERYLNALCLDADRARNLLTSISINGNQS